VMKLITQFSPASCCFLFLGLKYLPQHPTVVHPQHLFFPSCGRLSFTPIQNDRQNQSCVHTNHELTCFLNSTIISKSSNLMTMSSLSQNIIQPCSTVTETFTPF
jgi:hypothetical protein